MLDYVRLGQTSTLLREKSGVADIKAYADMFIKMLGTVYDNLGVIEPYFFDGLTCVLFYFGECPPVFSLDSTTHKELRRLIYKEERQRSLRTIRIVRYYAENFLILVKPDRLRYWIRSAAIRDADETLIDLREQGY
jgi:hypothetical protein